MSRSRRGRYLRCAEQTAWSRVRGVSSGGNPHVRGEGIPACKRVVRLHRRPALQHRRPGLPTVRVRPLADPARRPVRGRLQALRCSTGEIIICYRDSFDVSVRLELRSIIVLLVNGLE